MTQHAEELWTFNKNNRRAGADKIRTILEDTANIGSLYNSLPDDTFKGRRFIDQSSLTAYHERKTDKAPDNLATLSMAERAMLSNVSHTLPPEWNRTTPYTGDMQNTWNPTDYMRRYGAHSRTSKRRSNTVELSRVAAANHQLAKQEDLGGVPMKLFPNTYGLMDGDLGQEEKNRLHDAMDDLADRTMGSFGLRDEDEIPLPTDEMAVPSDDGPTPLPQPRKRGRQQHGPDPKRQKGVTLNP